LATLLIQILAFHCSDSAPRCDKSLVSDICESMIVDQKMFDFVGRWFCRCEGELAEAAIIVSSLLLLTVSVLLGPEVDDCLRDLVHLKVCLIAAEHAGEGIIGRYANALKWMLGKNNAPREDIDEATIRMLLPSPLELLVPFLGSDVDEEACCSWCGRFHNGLVMC
jgi:hypothetical protein